MAAALGGAALGLFALWASLWVLIVGSFAAQAPDPFVLDGDPCCGHPDTWLEVLAGAAAMLVGTARGEGFGGLEVLRYDDDLEVVLRDGRVESVGVAGELGG